MRPKKKLESEIKKLLPNIKENVLLKNFTTFKIGGPAKYFLIVKNKKELIFALSVAKKLKLPVFILGKGSNLLVSDKGFKGLVIKNEIDEILIKDNKIKVGAGVDLTKLSFLLAEKGLTGLEWAAGILGSVGGAIYGNAQAFSGKMSDVVKNVEVFDLKSLKVKNFENKDCQFSLKNSIFKKKKNLIIISAILKLKKESSKEIKKRMREYIKYRKERQPLDYPSAGSVFVNPEKKIRNKMILSKFPQLKEFNKKGIIPAGFLIEKCGLLGKKVGQAQISPKHGNFIINLGGAKAKDVIKLIKIIQNKVKKIFKLKLEPEIIFVGFN